MPDQAAEAIERVAISVERLATASSQLHDDVGRMNRQQRAQGVLLLGLTIVVVLLVIGGVVDYYERQAAKRSRDRIETLAREIEDCTTPSGECSQRSADRVASAIAQINQTSIAIAICQERQVPNLEQCVMTRLTTP